MDQEDCVIDIVGIFCRLSAIDYGFSWVMVVETIKTWAFYCFYRFLCFGGCFCRVGQQCQIG